MALLEAAMIAMLTQGPAHAVGTVGYDELVDGRNHAAIETIESNTAIAEDDPARLLNLGVAKARVGDYEAARAHFQAVIECEERVELETAEGKWVDSRHLARKALTMLDRGEFARYYALSMK